MAGLDGKVVLITGIGSGIGRAAAQLFAQRGATVFGVDRHPEQGRSLLTELQQQGHRFHFHQADLSTETACRGAIAACLETCGRLDVLYNNAGISYVEPFTETTAEKLDHIFAVNFKSVYFLCQQAIPIMKAQGGGVIINTASELAIVAQPLYAAYCATKGAVLSLTRSLALEYAQDNLQINTLCPGPIQTPMLQMEFDLAENPDQAKAEGIATMPIGRLGTPEEVAQVALWLASDAPPLIQGASIVVDGGKTIL